MQQSIRVVLEVTIADTTKLYAKSANATMIDKKANNVKTRVVNPDVLEGFEVVYGEYSGLTFMAASEPKDNDAAKLMQQNQQLMQQLQALQAQVNGTTESVDNVTPISATPLALPMVAPIAPSAPQPVVTPSKYRELLTERNINDDMWHQYMQGVISHNEFGASEKAARDAINEELGKRGIPKFNGPQFKAVWKELKTS